MRKSLALLICLLTMTFVPACAEEKADCREVTYSLHGYTLTLCWEDGIQPDPELAKTLREVFFLKYPAIYETFGTCEECSFIVKLNNNPNIRYTSCLGKYCELLISYERLKNEPNMLDAVVRHFALKVIGIYDGADNDPTTAALSEGLVFYAGHVYAVDHAAGSYLIPYEPGQKLSDSSQVAGAFLLWVAQTYGEDVPIRLNRVLHEGSYDSLNFWLMATGDTLGNLWNTYVAQSQ